MRTHSSKANETAPRNERAKLSCLIQITIKLSSNLPEMFSPTTSIGTNDAHIQQSRATPRVRVMNHRRRLEATSVNSRAKVALLTLKTLAQITTKKC